MISHLSSVWCKHETKVQNLIMYQLQLACPLEISLNLHLIRRAFFKINYRDAYYKLRGNKSLLGFFFATGPH